MNRALQSLYIIISRATSYTRTHAHNGKSSFRRTIVNKPFGLVIREFWFIVWIVCIIENSNNFIFSERVRVHVLPDYLIR